MLDVARLNKRLESAEKKATTMHNQYTVLLDKNKEMEKSLENPLLKLKELADDEDMCYVWLLDRKKDCMEFSIELTAHYHEQMGRDPKAMHLVLHHVDDISLFNRSQVEGGLKKWLRS